MFEVKQPSSTSSFFLGFFAGIGAGLSMFVATLLLGAMLAKIGSETLLRHFPGVAAIWGILSVAFFIYIALSSMEKRPSIFRAGLATAFAVIMLLDTACWSVHF